MIRNGELEELELLDEVFQVCVFLQVYAGLPSFTVDDIAKMVNADKRLVEHCVEILARNGYLRVTGDGITVTDEGLNTADSRFSDEFKFFHGSAHGFCNDPDCDCHRGDPSSCSIHSSENRVVAASKSWRKGLRLELPRRGVRV